MESKKTQNFTGILSVEVAIESEETLITSAENTTQIIEDPAKFSHGALVPLVMLSLSILLNVRVIFKVTQFPLHKQLPINILVENLSLAVLALTLSDVVFIGGNLQLVRYAGSISCGIQNAVRNVMYASYIFSAVAVIYERAGTFRDSVGEFLVFRVILLIWTCALFLGLPSYFSVEYVEHEKPHLGYCKKVALFGSIYASIIHYLLRFLFLHLLPFGFLLFVLYNIRSRVTFLYFCKPIPCREVRTSVQRLRYVYIYCMIFIFLWLPVGFVVLAYSLIGRTGRSHKSLEGIIAILYLINFFWINLSPAAFIFMNEDVIKNKNCFSINKICRKQINNNNTSQCINV